MRSLSRLLFLAGMTLLGVATPVEAAAGEQAKWKFDFGGEAADGHTVARPDALFSAEAGFGFEKGATVTAIARGGADKLRDGFATGAQPFLFSVAVPEGVYRVTLLLGDAKEAGVTTVKAEARRLMVEKVETKPGEFVTRSFAVAVKRPGLKSGNRVKLKPTEQGHRDWDDVLTLEFSNARPCLCALEIAPAKDVTTVWIAGDSTVTDQRNEPYAGWGQMLPRFFNESVAVANHAQSGETLGSFQGAQRFDKIFENIRPGDYLFIQFGHNDQKDKRPGAGPFTSYKERLAAVVRQAREKQAVPVVVTSMERRAFDGGGKITPSLTDFAEAARQVSREENAPLIDLHAMSIQFYEALGPEASLKAFVHYPAGTFPGQSAALRDNTHFSAYGGYELARCMVEGIRSARLGLAKSLAPDAAPFDPAKPGRPEDFALPGSSPGTAEKPEGN